MSAVVRWAHGLAAEAEYACADARGIPTFTAVMIGLCAVAIATWISENGDARTALSMVAPLALTVWLSRAVSRWWWPVLPVRRQAALVAIALGVPAAVLLIATVASSLPPLPYPSQLPPCAPQPCLPAVPLPAAP